MVTSPNPILYACCILVLQQVPIMSVVLSPDTVAYLSFTLPNYPRKTVHKTYTVQDRTRCYDLIFSRTILLGVDVHTPSTKI
jgi:hypothetical protein